MLLGGVRLVATPGFSGLLDDLGHRIETRSQALKGWTPLVLKDASTDSAPWYRRMLGASSLSWQAIIFAGILNFPQMVLTGGNLGARTVQPNEYPTIAAISAATVLASFVYGYLGHLTVFRNRHIRPVSLTMFLSFYAFGGLLYSVGIQISDVVSGSPSDVPFALRAIDAMLLSIAWGIGVSLILDGRSRFRIERESLIRDLVAEQEQATRQSDIVRAGSHNLSASIDSSLTQHLRAIEVAAERYRISPGSSRELTKLAEAIDSAADLGARESSHRYWEEALTTAVTPRFGQTLRTALASPQIWPAPIAVLVALGVPTVAVRNFGLLWAIPATVVLGLITWLWLRAVQTWRLSTWGVFAVSFTGTVVLVTAFAIVPPAFASKLSAEIGSIPLGLAGGFLLVSFVATLQRERRDVLRALKQGVLVEEAQRISEARAVAQVARRLHGPVQTKLRICAAEIERAADRGDTDAVDRAVEVAMRSLIEATQETHSSQIPLDDALRDLAQTWAGFVDVTFDVDAALKDSLGSDDIVEVVNEAIANAYHHGGATRADVRVEHCDDGISVTVRDDGSADSMNEPGLGTRLLRGVSSHYELSLSPTGATLQVLLPHGARTTVDDSLT
jgi:signal transduction histidine kinase